MSFTEYLIPTLILITAGYVLIALFYYKKSKLVSETLAKAQEDNSLVTKKYLETNEKISDLSTSFDDSLIPALKNIELEIKNINCNFTADLVLEKLHRHGYEKAKLVGKNTIVTGVILGRADLPEGYEQRVGHVLTLELDCSSILIESYSLSLNAPDQEVYEFLLKENASYKVSDFGIKVVNDITFLIAQAYVVYPKDSFHITPLIEALDHLENAQLSTANKLSQMGCEFTNISLQDYSKARITQSERNGEKSS